MNYFLNKSAKYIFNQHAIDELASICVVLPTRRGCQAFKKELGITAGQPIIAPQLFAIEDFILNATQLTLFEPIDLVFELFKAFKSVDEKVQLEQFMSWAPTVLKDFESIDQYQVEAKQLFDFMTEAKAIERWGISDINSKKPEYETSVSKYFELFKVLHQTYSQFNQNLNLQNKAYRGSAYRKLADNAENILLENSTFSKYYFLGFNALSLSEHKIINTLIVAKKAEILWDTDDYYMERGLSGQIAGQFLKPYKYEASFGNGWNWQENKLTTRPINIKIAEVANKSLQPIIAGHYLDIWAKRGDINQNTALILADENMLLPVLSQLPKTVENYNITMGLSLKNSNIFDLIEILFELHQTQTTTSKTSKYNTRLLIKLLNHSIIANYGLKNNLNFKELVNFLLIDNQIFTDFISIKNSIKNEQLIDVFIESWLNNPQKAILQLKKVLNFIFENSNEIDNKIEIQFLANYNTIFNRLSQIVSENLTIINLNSLKNMLFELVRNQKIPFEGGQEDALQIMGMLETRTLDFERIIIVSTNEGFLPAGKKSNTLIPFDALKELNMPTYGHQDAVMAYHFFRLLQNADEVVLLYVKPNSNNGNKEKSRFIMQIEYELTKLNPNIVLEYPKFELDFTDNEKFSSDFSIEKTDEIINQIEKELTNKGLYATALNEYQRCSMQYYFNRVAKIAPPNEIEHHIGSDVFGTWIHATLERIGHEWMAKGEIVKSDYEEVKSNIKKRLELEFETQFPKHTLAGGMNHILLNVAEKVLSNYFENEIKNGLFPQEIMALEQKYTTELVLNIFDKILKIKVGGKIDRIEKVGNSLRVIDFKTGKVSKSDLKLNDKFVAKNDIDAQKAYFLNEPKLEKLRQLWLYKYLIVKEIHANKLFPGKIFNEEFIQIDAGIYSFRNIVDGFLNCTPYIFPHLQSDSEFIAFTEELIALFIEKLLDKSHRFSITDDLATCKYCNYNTICNRVV